MVKKRWPIYIQFWNRFWKIRSALFSTKNRLCKLRLPWAVSPLVKQIWCAVRWVRKRNPSLRRNVNPLYKVLSIMALKSPLQMKYLTCSFTLPAMVLINPIVRPMRILRTKRHISRRIIFQNLWPLPWPALCRIWISLPTILMPVKNTMCRSSVPMWTIPCVALPYKVMPFALALGASRT